VTGLASNMKLSLALVVHTCNPRFSGASDEEDPGLSHPRQEIHEILSIKYITLKGLMQ
jgi:hypothetical protein